MGLKISLKPQERFILGGAVVSNGPSRSELLIENDVVILRERDIMSEAEAATPCKRIYFIIQLMYIDGGNIVAYHGTYWKLVQDVVNAAPSTLAFIDEMSGHILNNRYYQALKTARKLVDYEEEVVNRVRCSARSI